MPILQPQVDRVPLGMTIALTIFLCLIPFASAETQQQCLNIGSNVQYKPEELEGTWYPVEIVLHRDESNIFGGVPLNTQCPAVTFTPKGDKTLIMLWNSRKGDLEKTFELKGRNQWQSTYDQKGSLLDPGEYRQFRGVFSVLKIHDDYMILTYCSKQRGHLLNTVAFSKNGTMPEEVMKEALDELGQKVIKYRKWRVTRDQSCDEEETGGYSHRTGGYRGNSHRIVSSCMLLVLPSLVVRFLL